MPIYEYVCQSCGEEVEKLQRLSDEPLTECPVCGKPELKRKISAAGFRLAGGGWYETDFKSDGRRNIASDSGKSGSADSAASGGESGAKASSKSDDAKSSASKSGSQTSKKSSDTGKKSTSSSTG